MQICVVDFVKQFGCPGMKPKRPAVILKRSKKHYTVALMTQHPNTGTKLCGYHYKDDSFDGWIKLDNIYVVDAKHVRKIYYKIDKVHENEIRKQMENINQVKYFKNFDTKFFS